MFSRVLAFVVIATILFNQDFVGARTRQKRCIVIQKQSGSHGDSTEDDGADEEYRKPEPKAPRPDRLRASQDSRDVENLSPELLKYKSSPMRSLYNNRLRNRYFRKHLH